MLGHKISTAYEKVSSQLRDLGSLKRKSPSNRVVVASLFDLNEHRTTSEYRRCAPSYSRQVIEYAPPILPTWCLLQFTTVCVSLALDQLFVVASCGLKLKTPGQRLPRSASVAAMATSATLYTVICHNIVWSTLWTQNHVIWPQLFLWLYTFCKKGEHFLLTWGSIRWSYAAPCMHQKLTLDFPLESTPLSLGRTSSAETKRRIWCLTP